MDFLQASARLGIGSGESPESGEVVRDIRARNPRSPRRDAVARSLMSWSPGRDGNMLDIATVSTDDERTTYALSGEITADQLERLQSLILTAMERGRAVAFDLQRVWRVDRQAAVLIARYTCRPTNNVRIVGLPAGLLEWLRTVTDAQPRT
jgi:ABC-type transporter Mla MlaB component